MKNELVINKTDLENVMRNVLSSQRQDVRKKICSLKDVLHILDMSERKFYDHIKSPDCLIRLSALRGKYVLQSVYDEADRLNGENK